LRRFLTAALASDGLRVLARYVKPLDLPSPPDRRKGTISPKVPRTVLRDRRIRPDRAFGPRTSLDPPLAPIVAKESSLALTDDLPRLDSAPADPVLSRIQ
jgi:hypothetical protein